MFRRILVPVHGGVLDQHAIKLAASVVDQKGGTDLTLVYVVEVPQRLALDSDLPRQIEDGESFLQDAKRYAESLKGVNWRRISTELLQARLASSAIVDESIERGSEAIILASANRRRRGTLTQGDTVPFILDHAPCTVLLVRPTTLDGNL